MKFEMNEKMTEFKALGSSYNLLYVDSVSLEVSKPQNVNFHIK